MLFKEIIGQQETINKLIKNVKNQRISHAQLFICSEGTGGLPIALAYAQFILCTNKQENDSCGTCPSCKKLIKLSHPDLHYVYPVITTPKLKKPISTDYISQWRNFISQDAYIGLPDWLEYIKAGNKQGMIYAHESNEITKKLNLKPYESEYKIMIIWLPELMNIACANKLLKMIEEPPVNTIILMVTENEENIINTIRSRCQSINIPAINSKDMISHLEKLDNPSGKNLDNIAHTSRGNYNLAKQLLNPESHDKFNHENFIQLMRICYSRKYAEVFNWSESMAQIGREKQKLFLSYSLNQIRENFMYNIQNPDIIYLNDEELDFSSKFARFINERNMISMNEEFDHAYIDISMNGNANIIFTDLALKIIKLIKK